MFSASPWPQCEAGHSLGRKVVGWCLDGPGWRGNRSLHATGLVRMMRLNVCDGMVQGVSAIHTENI
jgi:hypothetical protein